MTNNMIFVYFYAAIFILVFIGIPIEKKIRTLIVNRKVEKTGTKCPRDYTKGIF